MEGWEVGAGVGGGEGEGGRVATGTKRMRKGVIEGKSQQANSAWLAVMYYM